MKKIPQRKCIGCRGSFDKNTLLRIVKTPEGDILVDSTGKLNGRGAYICRNEKCFDMAYKKKQLEYAFKEKVDSSVYERLKEEI